jgi:hypothetical protein
MVSFGQLSSCADTIIVFLNEVLQFLFIGITHLILDLKSCFKGAVVVVILWLLALQLPMQSVYITTDVVSSYIDQGDVYNIM